MEKFLPVPVNMFGAVGVADMDQGGVDHDVLLAAVEQVIEQTQVAVAASDAVARAVLVQDEHLPGRVPSCGENSSQWRRSHESHKGRD